VRRPVDARVRRLAAADGPAHGPCGDEVDALVAVAQARVANRSLRRTGVERRVAAEAVAQSASVSASRAASPASPRTALRHVTPAAVADPMRT
jgi:hypothetical protein